MKKNKTIEELAKRHELEKGSVTIAYGDCEVLVEGYFCDERVADDEIPEGYKKMEVRTSDSDDSIYATLEKQVRVNFACTFITNDETLESFEDEEYLEIADWDYGECVTVIDGGDNTAGESEVYVVLHEYDDEGECGSSVCGVFKSFEKAKEKLNLVSANEFEEAKSVWGEDALFNRDGDVCFITNNVARKYDNFRIETAYLE